MPARGKHRSTRPNPNPIARAIAVAAAGGAALSLPLVGATTANAAQPPRIAPAIAQSAPQAVQAAQPARSLTYTVVKGDTLYKIADKYDVRGGWAQLYKDNRAAIGKDPQVIRPGLKLKVTTAKANATTKASTASKPATKAVQAVAKTAPAAAKTYPDNLDGWIRESLDVMRKHGIPGTYDGIYRNIMRESSGNPAAINNWDSNAAAGTPSKGLLQVIDPTFQAYHVPGTPWDPYDPVANITAACNYAAARYGSIDNVFGPY